MKAPDIRRAKLRLWVGMHGTPSKEKSFFSQLLSGEGSFGERAARRLERDYQMGDNYLDDPAGLDISGSNVVGISSKALASKSEIDIPQFKDLGGSMGAGLLMRDQPGEIHGWRVTPEWISKNVKNHTGASNLRIVTGFGDSMRPLFNPGDPLLVDSGVKTVDFDSIYFFRIGDEGFIKRLQRVPGQGLLAISENKSYRDWVITEDMDFQVFARVIKVWCGSEF